MLYILTHTDAAFPYSQLFISASLLHHLLAHLACRAFLPIRLPAVLSACLPACLLHHLLARPAACSGFQLKPCMAFLPVLFPVVLSACLHAELPVCLYVLLSFPLCLLHALPFRPPLHILSD
jgi:hypothetical protein